MAWRVAATSWMVFSLACGDTIQTVPDSVGDGSVGSSSGGATSSVGGSLQTGGANSAGGASSVGGAGGIATNNDASAAGGSSGGAAQDAGPDGPSCEAGAHACGATCEKNDDPKHCGPSCTACPAATNADPVCVMGGPDGWECKTACHAGDLVCAGACIDPLTDKAHCGANLGCGVGSGTAGVACLSVQECVGGGCKCVTSAASTAATCLDCCKQAYPNTVAKYSQRMYECACAPCYDICADSLCNSQTPSPTPACVACVKQNANIGSFCMGDTTACDADPACVSFRQCANGCIP